MINYGLGKCTDSITNKKKVQYPRLIRFSPNTKTTRHLSEFRSGSQSVPNIIPGVDRRTYWKQSKYRRRTTSTTSVYRARINLHIRFILYRSVRNKFRTRSANIYRIVRESTGRYLHTRPFAI